jgi:hypothetical protein
MGGQDGAGKPFRGFDFGEREVTVRRTWDGRSHQGTRPVLLYRISKTETRMLIAVRVPLPPDLKV